MPLQQIRPDFSGSAESMAQAQRGIQGVGQFANDWLDRLAKEKAVATEQARYDTELARQKVLDTRATTQYEQQQKERADLLAMKTAVGQGLLGIPEDALTPQIQPTNIQQTGYPQNTTASQGRSVVVPGTQGRNIVTTPLGVYKNPNPEIIFNQRVTSTAPSNALSKDREAYMQRTENALQSQGLYNTGVSSLIGGDNTLNRKGTDILTNAMKAYDTRNVPILGTPKIESKVVSKTTKLNDIDLTTLYNTKGKPVGAKDTGDGSKVYYKNVEGALVNAMDVAKGAITKENSYVQGKSETTYKPGTPSYTKYISGTANKEFIGSNGTTVPVKSVVGSVQGSMSSYQDIIDKMSKGTTADKITKISNDITRDVLKAHPELAHMAIDIQEMAKKGVGLKLPDGSLTKTEEMKLVAAGEDLKHQYDVAKENRGYDQAWRLQQSSQGFQAGQNALSREQSARQHREKLLADKTNVKESPYSKALQTTSGKLYAESLFDPSIRAKRIEDRAKALLPQHEGMFTFDSTASKKAREAAMKEIDQEDAAVIKRMKETQI